MKNNSKIITKISLALMIVGLKFIKPATTAELRSVGSSEPTASNAETAGDVWQTVNIAALNLAGDELGSYTVRRDDTLAKLNKKGAIFDYFLLPGKSEILNQLRTIGNILEEQDPTGESDVLTLLHVRSTTSWLDPSLLNTNDLPVFGSDDFYIDPKDRDHYDYRKIHATKMDNRRQSIEYVADKLLTKDSSIQINLLARKSEYRVFFYVSNGDDLYHLCSVPINEAPRVLYYGTMDPTIFKMFKEDDDIPVFLNASLDAKFGKVTHNQPYCGQMTFNCDNIRYKCIYIDNKYVVASISLD